MRDEGPLTDRRERACSLNGGGLPTELFGSSCRASFHVPKRSRRGEEQANERSIAARWLRIGFGGPAPGLCGEVRDVFIEPPRICHA